VSRPGMHMPNCCTAGHVANEKLQTSGFTNKG